MSEARHALTRRGYRQPDRGARLCRRYARWTFPRPRSVSGRQRWASRLRCLHAHRRRRDLRLDLFRGIALWLIFSTIFRRIIVNWITIRDYGFGDATGYSFSFDPYHGVRLARHAERGIMVAGARVLRVRGKSMWRTFFCCHLHGRDRLCPVEFYQPGLRRGNGRTRFHATCPDETIVQALILKFKPVHMDVLPLYIVLLFCFAVLGCSAGPTIALGLRCCSTRSIGISA